MRTLALAFGLASTASAADPLTCTAKGIEPSAPKHALKFCHIFPDKSCCLPAQDNEIEEHYFNLLDAGDICAKESSMAKDALKQIFCAACSPREPEYLLQDGDTTYFKICSGLADKVRPEKITDASGVSVPTSNPFDACGMVVVEERGAVCKGDDVVVPSQHWKNCKSGDAVQPRGGEGCDLGGTTYDAGCPESYEGWPTVPWNTPTGAAGGGTATCTAGQIAFAGEKKAKEQAGEYGAYSACGLSWGGDCVAAQTGYEEEACNGAAKPRWGSANNDTTWRNCNSEYKFINDPSGAKPPFLDDYTMMIVDCDLSDPTCNTKCYTGAAASLQATLFNAYTLVALMSAISMIVA